MIFLLNCTFARSSLLKFDYEPTIDQAAGLTVMTKSGFKKYAGTMVDEIIHALMNERIDVDIDFKISSYRFRLVDAVITAVEIGYYTEELYEYNPQIAIKFEDATIEARFSISIIQEIYPYFEDRGFGKLKALGSLFAQINTDLGAEYDYVFKGYLFGDYI